MELDSGRHKNDMENRSSRGNDSLDSILNTHFLGGERLCGKEDLGFLWKISAT